MSRRSARAPWFFLGALVPAMVAGCSGGGGLSSAPGSGAGGSFTNLLDGGHPLPNAGGAGGSSSTTPTGAGGLFDTSTGGNATFADGAACAALVQQGEAIPLDMYIMLDKSSSMLDATGAGPTKWDAIRSALESFVQDPASNGLGVGLQYFPILKNGVPATCTANSDCGTGGPCFLDACANQNTLNNCTTDADCGNVRGACVPFGVCEYYPQGGNPEFCAPINTACDPGYGNCIDITDRWCVNGTECTAAPYQTPDVPIAELPAGAMPIVNSLMGTTPLGQTPTAPALQGAIDQATTYATANPGHKVVAVLATDGLPTECTPTDIGPVSAFATAGVNGTPSVPTFVIGVFGPDDTDSQTNLDTIAKAGGTDHAYIIDTSGDVATQFRDALNAISGSKLLSCELKVPAATTGSQLDYQLVNLETTDAAGKKTQLVYVESQSKCATAASTGWYYDNDPAAGGTPTKIEVCPDVCTGFQSSAGETVSLQIGCRTIIE
ncbi:MAG TPA: hypothetical protein VH142_08855 [Polyangiaceae bacterium]|nr:hypothetical protein [Polyangiaceae bacterium]